MKSSSPRIENRRAFHDYFIERKLECGIVLLGSEVKAIRSGRASLAEGFARVEDNGELWLYDVDISPYANAAVTSHEPKRKRKLLAHGRQIKELGVLTGSKGWTLVPLTIFFNARGIAKLELGIGRGKSHYDKRESLKKKDAEATMRRAMTRRKI